MAMHGDDERNRAARRRFLRMTAALGLTITINGTGLFLIGMVVGSGFGHGPGVGEEGCRRGGIDEGDPG